MNGCEYLVAHGCAGSLGRFRAPEEYLLGRGDAVVIRGRRGLELGAILGRPERAKLPDEFVGDLLRPATSVDRETNVRNTNLSRQLCTEAEAIVAAIGLPFAVLDAEVLLDGRSAILHG